MTRQFKSAAEMRRFEHAQRERARAKQARFNARHPWTDVEIRAEFDSNPNITVSLLAFMAGKTVEQVKKILLEE